MDTIRNFKLILTLLITALMSISCSTSDDTSKVTTSEIVNSHEYIEYKNAVINTFTKTDEFFARISKADRESFAKQYEFYDQSAGLYEHTIDEAIEKLITPKGLEVLKASLLFSYTKHKALCEKFDISLENPVIYDLISEDLMTELSPTRVSEEVTRLCLSMCTNHYNMRKWHAINRLNNTVGNYLPYLTSPVVVYTALRTYVKDMNNATLEYDECIDGCI